MARFGTSRDNVILNDARVYYAERRGMNNPKGWDHVYRLVLRAMTGDVYHGIDNGAAVSHQAIIVLRRLARLDPR